MKKRIFGCLILLFTVFLVGCDQKQDKTDVMDKIIQRGKIVVGVKYDTKPFGFMNEKGFVEGFDVDLARYIAKSILGNENRIEFKQVTPSNRILALNSGEVDMVIATMSVTKQRAEVIDFSKPYYVAGQAILVPRTSKINSMSDLNGKRVIVIFGSTAEKQLRLVAPDADILGFKTYTSGYSALKQGRADALTSDDTILMNFAMMDDSLKLLPTRYSKELYAVAFKKGIQSERLKSRVDFIISDMQKSGKLNQLKAKWVKF